LTTVERHYEASRHRGPCNGLLLLLLLLRLLTVDAEEAMETWDVTGDYVYPARNVA